MNRFFPKRSILFIFFSLTASPMLNGMFDDLSFDDPFCVSMADAIDIAPAPTRTCAFTPQDIAALLINANAQNILQNNLYLHTNTLNRRSLLDDPIFLQQRTLYTKDRVFGAHLFWNHMPRDFFTAHSSCINSYLALSDPDLIESLEGAGEIAEQTFNINYKDILPLLGTITIQGRQLGLMFHGARFFDRVQVRAYAPLYYFERNFFLCEAEQEKLEKQLGASSQDEQYCFASQHLISDKFGLGDTRLELNVESPWNYGKMYMLFGAFATIPTAFAFKKGLAGSFFPKCSARPSFDLTELICLGASDDAQEKQQALDMTEKFFLGALDELSANLLDVPLGSKSFGLGAAVYSEWPVWLLIKRPWAQEVMFKGRMSFEYLFPHKECRYYIQCSDTAEFNALGLNRSSEAIQDQIADDPVYAEKVVAFLGTQFVETFYPFVFPTTVRPGMIFRSTSKASHESERWGFDFGTDTWIQLQEKLYDIKQIGNRPPNISLPKATRPFAYQGKLVFELYFILPRELKDWTIGINADQTFFSSGIGGDDYTVSLNLEANF